MAAPSSRKELSDFLNLNLGGMAHHKQEDNKENIAPVVVPTKTVYKDLFKGMNECAVRATRKACDLHRMRLAVEDSDFDDAKFALFNQHTDARKVAQDHAQAMCYVFKLAADDPEGVLRPYATDMELLHMAEYNTVRFARDAVKKILANESLKVHVSQHKVVYLRTKVRIDDLKAELCRGVVRAEAEGERLFKDMIPFVEEVAEHLWAELCDPLTAGADQDESPAEEHPAQAAASTTSGSP
jgi:hypothetical protein